MEYIVPSRSLRRWDALLSRRRVLPRSLRPTTSRHVVAASAAAAAVAQKDARDDPFDASDLAVPPTATLVETHLRRAEREWKDLEERRIDVREESDIDDADENKDGGTEGDGRWSIAKSRKRRRGPKGGGEVAEGGRGSDDDNEDDDGDRGGDKVDSDDETVRPKKKSWAFRLRQDRRLLPEKFDVTCRNRPPSNFAHSAPAAEPITTTTTTTTGRKRDGGSGSSSSSNTTNSEDIRVVSLLDPSVTLDYVSELYDIFASVPSESEIERRATDGSICRNGLALAAEIEEAVKDYTRVDGHALGRMRLADRHRVPPLSMLMPPATFEGDTAKRTRQHRMRRQACAISTANATMIRIELWRRHPKRGSSPSSDRAVLDLDGRHTLLDVHRAAVEMSGQRVRRGANERGGRGTGEQQELLQSRLSDVATGGMFFIEGTFYVLGDEGSAEPVARWLGLDVDVDGGEKGGGTDGYSAGIGEGNMDGGGEREKDRDDAAAASKKGRTRTPRALAALRRNYLGVPSSSSSLPTVGGAGGGEGGGRQVGGKALVRPMSGTRLSDLPFRLGVRYLHSWDGGRREASLFFTDVRCCRRRRRRMEGNGEYVPSPPAIRDVWSDPASGLGGGSVPVRDCAGCRRLPPSAALWCDDWADGGPITPLCAVCLWTLRGGVGSGGGGSSAGDLLMNGSANRDVRAAEPGRNASTTSSSSSSSSSNSPCGGAGNASVASPIAGRVSDSSFRVYSLRDLRARSAWYMSHEGPEEPFDSGF